MARHKAMTKSGILYGLGVGPGDPELMTVKAWRLISSVAVIAFPRPDSADSLARRIAAPFIPETAIEVEIAIPMRTEREPAQAAYDAGAAQIAAHLEAGRDVAFLCEGDPLFYGSFMYLLHRLKDRHEVVVVPGVTSLTAAAAALGRPLAARADVLKVIPATAGMDRLAVELETAQAAAIIKVGRHFDQVRAVIERLGLADAAFVVEAATRSDERITALADVARGAKPYFSTILIYRGGEPW
jgi:precorrin-2/cobalt-factor-2 C20-methyltransferase